MTPNGKNAVLWLTRKELQRVIARLPESELASVAGGSGAGAVADSIAQIARSSRHTACRRDSGSGRDYCIFDGSLAGRGFRILVQPDGDARYRIVSIRSNDRRRIVRR